MKCLRTFSSTAASNDSIEVQAKSPGVVVPEDRLTKIEHEVALPATLDRRQDARSLLFWPYIPEALTERPAKEALAIAQYYYTIASRGGYVAVYSAIPWPSAVAAHVLTAAPDRRSVHLQETLIEALPPACGRRSYARDPDSFPKDEGLAPNRRLFEADVDVIAVVILNSVRYSSTFFSYGPRDTPPSWDNLGPPALAFELLHTVTHSRQNDCSLFGWHYGGLFWGTEQYASRFPTPTSYYYPRLTSALHANHNLAFPDGRSRGSMRLFSHLVAGSLFSVARLRTSTRFGQSEVGRFITFVLPPLLPTILGVGDTSCHSKDQLSKRTHSNNSVILSSQARLLQRKVWEQIRSLGFHSPTDSANEVHVNDKEHIRNLHRFHRLERLSASADFLLRHTPKLLDHFASGKEVNVADIQPELERVYAKTWQADLFRLAALTWSVPVSNGFGRRLRYLVWDRHNQKLLGLIAIGDPVFNLSVRDALIGWDVSDRSERLVNVMDAYVLGAMPPYNMLLAGKLVACLVRSRQIYDEFTCTYGNTVGVISGKAKQSRLLTVTTSSSMGRSSVYNRLKLCGVQYFQPIGYTRGWGHFHISEDLFHELRDYLRSIGHEYADQHRFGQGPNWRLRTTRAALTALGLRDDLLRHGIRRQVFICNLASNAPTILRTGKGTPDLSALLTVRQIADLAIERWIIPRARRRPDYRSWDRSDVLRLLGDPDQASHMAPQCLNATLAF